MNGFSTRSARDHALADRIAMIASRSIAFSGRFVCGLAGGTSPLGLYSVLQNAFVQGGIALDACHLIWIDACVDISNESYRGERGRLESAVSRIGVPQSQILSPIAGHSAKHAAKLYSDSIRLACPKGNTHQQPALDVAILGFGADGHVASLFPCEPNPEAATLVHPASNDPTSAHSRFIVLSEAFLKRTSHLLFIGNGRDKLSLARDVESGNIANDLPAARLRGRVTTEWFVAAC